MLAVFESSKLLVFKILGMQPVTCGGYWSTVPKVPPSRTVQDKANDHAGWKTQQMMSFIEESLECISNIIYRGQSGLQLPMSWLQGTTTGRRHDHKHKRTYVAGELVDCGIQQIDENDVARDP